MFLVKRGRRDRLLRAVRYLEGQYARHRAGRRCSCASAPTHHLDAVPVDREYPDPPARLMSPRYREQRCKVEYQPLGLARVQVKGRKYAPGYWLRYTRTRGLVG